MYCRVTSALKFRWLLLSVVLFVSIVQASYEAIASPTPDQSEKAVGVPTHRQATKIQVNADGRQQVKVACFCLTADGRILAGCVGPKGEIRVLNSDGKLVDSWALPVKPEAIFAREDGAIFAAGEGQL